MIDGYDADDGWRMVEDEFFLTARRFTAHLHQAEYKRLNKLAAQRPRRNIDRSIDGRYEHTNLSKTSRRAQKQREKSMDALRKPFGAGQDVDEVDLEEDPFMKDSKLAA